MILYTLWARGELGRIGYTNQTFISLERISCDIFLPGEQIRSFSFWLGKDGDPN